MRAVKSAPEAISMEIKRLERQARNQLADYRSALMAHPTQAREALLKIFAGPLKFTPDDGHYRIEGKISANTAIFCGAPNSASLRG